MYKYSIHVIIVLAWTLKLVHTINPLSYFLDNRLFDAVSELRHENLSLTLQNEKLRQENLQSGPGSSDSRGTEKASVIYT